MDKWVKNSFFYLVAASILEAGKWTGKILFFKITPCLFGTSLSRRSFGSLKFKGVGFVSTDTSILISGYSFGIEGETLGH